MNRIAGRIDKAIKRGETEQPRHGRCIRCKGDWDTCPCNRAQVDALFEARKLQLAMKELGR